MHISGVRFLRKRSAYDYYQQENSRLSNKRIEKFTSHRDYTIKFMLENFSEEIEYIITV